MNQPNDIEGRCNARLKRCRDCNYGYSKIQYNLWQCPECGTQRGKCRNYEQKNGRCSERHGGKTPRGFANPNTKHGRTSKALPTRLAANYEAVISDPELVSLTSNIAVFSARLDDLLVRVDSGEAGRIWRELRETYAALEEAARRDDKEEQGRLGRKLGKLIGRGTGDYAAWDEYIRTAETLRRFVDSERKWYIQNQQVATTQEVMTLVGAILALIRANVTDPATLRVLASGLSELAYIEGK